MCHIWKTGDSLQSTGFREGPGMCGIRSMGRKEKDDCHKLLQPMQEAGVKQV